MKVILKLSVDRENDFFHTKCLGILEDDVDLKEMIDDILENILQEYDKNWDCVYDNGVGRVRIQLGLHSYIDIIVQNIFAMTL